MQHFNRYFVFLLAMGFAALLAAHSKAASLTHMLISFVALSILAMAALQSMTITLQNYLLKNHPLNNLSILQLLPPVETMQSLLFKVIWAGFIFLSLSLIGATIYLPNLIQNIAISKLLLSSLAWVLFATLLYGHYRSGWQDDVVTSRTLLGVFLLTIAYFGSKWIEQY